MVGQVASDRLSRTHFIFKLIERRAPDFSDMPPVEYLKTSSSIARSRVYGANFRWSSQQLSQRLTWIEK